MGRITTALGSVTSGIGRVWTDLVQIKDGLLDLDLEGRILGKLASLVYSATLGAALDALAAEDPDDQITGATWMIGWSIATSLFTGPFTVVFVLFWSFFLAWGVFRLSDDGARLWNTYTPDWDISIPGSGLLSKPKEYGTRSRRGED